VSRLCHTALLVLLLLTLQPGPLHAQYPPASVTVQATPDGRLVPRRLPLIPGAGIALARDPCVPDEVHGSWIDWLQRKVSRTVCGSALWFDGLFGESDVYQERDVSYGRIFLGLWWDERDGIDFKFRFRVRMALPQLEKRANLFLGRDDVDNFLSDQNDSAEGLPGSFTDSEEEEWLFGVGFAPVRGRRSRLSIEPGLRLKIPLDPYVKVHYRYNLFVEPRRTQVRFRETLFWRKSDGSGFTSRVDVEYMLSQRFLTRLSASGTVGESRRGVDWYSGLRLYHYLGSGRALAYLVEVFGETRKEVPIEDYGVRVTYRQSILRRWLFAELSGGLNWPRRTLAETREINPGLGIGFEMQYGRR
jgi:hypothetical protein